MMKDIFWQSLSRFESYDFVARWYEKAHQRKPNAAKVSQINACFIQGRNVRLSLPPPPKGEGQSWCRMH